MQTIMKFSRLHGALLLGIAIASLVISSDVSPYAVLLIGIVLLFFSRQLIKYGLFTVVFASDWYRRKRLPGYRKATDVLHWIDFQLTATPEDRRLRAKFTRQKKEHLAAQKHREKLRKRYRNMVYAPEDIAAFFDKYSVEVASLALVTDDSLPRRSQLGGVPRLMPDIEWPRSDISGLPLHFMAELHLAEIPRTAEMDALPTNGVLLFFSDMGSDEWENPRVLFQEQAGSPASVPQDLSEIDKFLRERRNWPKDTDPRLMPEYAVRPIARRIQTPTKYMPKDVDWNLTELARKHGEKVFAEHIKQRPDLRLSSSHYNYFTIGGPAFDLSNPTNGEGFKLLQFDSDDKLGWMIGDMGVLEFWIDSNDLANRRFDRCTWAGACC